MEALGPDELFLQGRLQVEAAIDALKYLGTNPEAVLSLQKFLSAHSILSNGDKQNDLMLYLKGGSIERDKADIVCGLGELSLSAEVTPSRRIAAQALLETLR